MPGRYPSRLATLLTVGWPLIVLAILVGTAVYALYHLAATDGGVTVGSVTWTNRPCANNATEPGFVTQTGASIQLTESLHYTGPGFCVIDGVTVPKPFHLVSAPFINATMSQNATITAVVTLTVPSFFYTGPLTIHVIDNRMHAYAPADTRVHTEA